MDRALEGRRVLVADDEPLIAMNLAEELEAVGAAVVGPAGTLENALALFADERVDVALLDVMLGNDFVYPLADKLAARGTPYAFATGYGVEMLPPDYADVPVCAKPFATDAVVETLVRALAGKP
ncbi:MAG: response regulator [Sphingomonadales bacterium]|nr:response regulator [Sphingomonadales bacterium]